MITARLLPVALLLAAMLPGAAAAQEGEDLPRIFLEKKVYSDMAGGKQSFFETHTVEKGETLWKILERKEPLTPDRYAERLKEFRRANPKVADPSRLAPGQKLLVPSGGRQETKDDGRTVGYTVKRGDSLSKILSSRAVPRRQWKKYLDVIREINPSVTDVNRIVAGKTLRLPTDRYFTEAKPPPEPEKVIAAAEPEKVMAAAEPPEPAPPVKPAVPPKSPEPEKIVPPEAGIAVVPPPVEVPPAPEVPPVPALTRDVAPGPGQDALAAGKPEAELLVPKPVSPTASVVETGKAKPAEEAVIPPARSPYRGLLSDLFLAIGEKWVDRGTMYLPLPSGGDAVLQLSDFPVVRFSGGTEALIDFRGGIPPRVVDAISAQWKSLRVVSLADAGGAGDRIDRILRVSGYHSVKEGISRPVVMGETVSVALPARWVIQRTEDSLLSGDLVLLKEVPEKPDPELLAVLRYARRVGLRVLPYADDPKAMEGFLVGVQEEASAGGIPVGLAVPKTGGLPAVDFGLSLLGIAAKTGERLRVGGEGDAFRLVVSPERLFEVDGKKYVVDTGKMSPAIRSILRESGYAVFPAGKDASGREIFQRLMKAAGVGSEERKEYLLTGGAKSGYEVRVTGAFLSLPGLSGGAGRRIVLVRRKIHSATRALLGDMGVEIVEW
ncbi:LysM peptidoglycan-binding domain-containing protein [Candidatus Deferrimicrobium sp.]|uniref:LysM peptidoglycan-binding domain-containing protein n=1 Tax=Candidatus Deferrimicrobium sp. TaxID=3060586 RepID=UPI00271842FC|nr:LysM peptidoglycan-binding domain-containing protein [Candidatus Deferrimicrobium sp.]MDO8737619.1 LysM peptidoglycan-binding domain-containing protein [Candidatus Deferrimicrobium sp.]